MRVDGEAGQAAEETAHGGTDRETARPFTALQQLAERVVEGDWWRQTGAPPVVMRTARSSARSSSARTAGGAVEIRLAGGQHDEATVIHELAHALAGLEHGHDATFRRANIDVAAVVAGASAAGAVADAYRAFGLEVAVRRWPPPVRALGSGFAIVP